MLDKGLKDGIAVQVLLRETYDKLYHIFDHDQPSAKDRPLALVALHEKERYVPHTRLHKLMERFVRYKVKERSGLSWTEFISQPRDIVEHWFNVCLHEQERENRDPNNTKIANEIKAMEQTLAERNR